MFASGQTPSILLVTGASGTVTQTEPLSFSTPATGMLAIISGGAVTLGTGGNQAAAIAGFTDGGSGASFTYFNNEKLTVGTAPSSSLGVAVAGGTELSPVRRRWRPAPVCRATRSPGSRRPMPIVTLTATGDLAIDEQHDGVGRHDRADFGRGDHPDRRHYRPEPALQIQSVRPGVADRRQHDPDQLAAQITGAGSSLTFNDTATNLSVTTVGAVNGITTNAGNVTLSTTTSGNITLSQSINTQLHAHPGGNPQNAAGTVSESGGTITASDADGPFGGRRDAGWRQLLLQDIWRLGRYRRQLGGT